MNRITSNMWDKVTGTGEIEISYDGALYTYFINSKYYYEKIIWLERRGRRAWIKMVKTFKLVDPEGEGQNEL